ncbi:MAG: histidine triad nucleotide-binding protein [candidate division KSB1 bacterium]|nr:histidine triad nucleotide-binding protein [candidate division KSB1 bacterium]MDQ7062952.1 histidine triad nucleotide-binding protein [candidate division KSB1 bacterium]
MADCIFCKIISGELKGDIVFQNEHLVAFRDINPQAPVHILIVPRKHIATLNDLTATDAAIISEMVLTAKKLAADEGVAEDGYRLVWNCNRGAGQTVFHIHLHLMGGRAFGWPPG